MTAAPAYDNSVRIGYARVSTRTQVHQAQFDTLAAAHCREILVETASTRDDRPDLAATTVSLKEITAARSARRRELRRQIAARASVVDRLIAVHAPPPASPPTAPTPAEDQPAPQLKLKRYREE